MKNEEPRFIIIQLQDKLTGHIRFIAPLLSTEDDFIHQQVVGVSLALESKGLIPCVVTAKFQERFNYWAVYRDSAGD